MKSKLVAKVCFLLSLLVLPFMVNININAKEEMDLSCIEKVKINENEIHLLINDTSGTISIENDHLMIETSFILYCIEGSAIAYNTVILDCSDDNILYAGLNFNTNTLNYIVIKQNKYYFSSLEFVKINVMIDLFNENIKEELLNANVMSYSKDSNKYLFLEETARSAFVCFSVDHNNISSANSRTAQSGYYLTGNDQNVVNEVSILISSGMLNPDEFVTVGVHNGLIYGNDGRLAYIYVIDTKLDQPWNAYAAGIKMWEVTYNYFSQESNTAITINIIPDRDIYIVGNEVSGQVQFPESDDHTYVPILDIKFDLTTTGLSYVTQYQIRCEYNGDPDTPSVFGYIDNLLVKYCPKYETVSQIIGVADSAISFFNEIEYDNLISSFSIYNGEETARDIGFQFSHDDVNPSFLTVKWLHLYSFHQTILLSNVPNYDITNFLRLQMVPTYHDDLTLSFIWNNTINNGCVHQQNYSNLDDYVHYARCNQCNKSFTEHHNKQIISSGSNEDHLLNCDNCSYSNIENHQYTHSYTQSGALNHIAYCSCGASKTEPHTFQPFKNGNRCKFCLYYTIGPISGGQIFGIDRSITYIDKKKDDYF